MVEFNEKQLLGKARINLIGIILPGVRLQILKNQEVKLIKNKVNWLIIVGRIQTKIV